MYKKIFHDVVVKYISLDVIIFVTKTENCRKFKAQYLLLGSYPVLPRRYYATYADFCVYEFSDSFSEIVSYFHDAVKAHISQLQNELFPQHCEQVKYLLRKYVI